MAERKNWTREETILAFDLYCKVPFSKISKTNEKIIDLAKVIGRTPSAVGLKMANLARFDKELQSRDVSGMSHGSKLDEEIWNEFCNNWEELSYQAQIILANRKQTTVEKMLDYIDVECIPRKHCKKQNWTVFFQNVGAQCIFKQMLYYRGIGSGVIGVKPH